MIRGKKELIALQRRTRARNAEERIVDVGGGGAGIREGWHGIIQSCDYAAGTADVKRAVGELGSLSAIGDEIECWQGLGSWHTEGEEVYVVPSGPGVTPRWTIIQQIRGARHYEPPDGGELAEDQDDPDVVTSCT